MTILYIVVIVVVAVFAIDALNRRRSRNLQQSGVYPPPGQGSQADVERLVALGRKIDAIKLYRQIHGVDLKAAKEAIDKISERADLRHR
jgi:ribosomal protein L7/L12